MSYAQFFIEPVFMIPFALGIMAVNVLLLVVFILVGSAFFKRMALSQDEAEKIRARARAEAEAVLTHARDEALKVMEDANRKLEETLVEIRTSSTAAEHRFEQSYESFLAKETERVAKGAADLLRAYEEAGMAARASYQKTADAVAQGVLGHTQDALVRFQKTLEEEVRQFRVAAEERFHEWQKNAAREVDAYKKESLKKVEGAVYEVLSLIAKEVIGKALSLEGQQELVMRALEEAKKEGFFHP